MLVCALALVVTEVTVPVVVIVGKGFTVTMVCVPSAKVHPELVAV